MVVAAKQRQLKGKLQSRLKPQQKIKEGNDFVCIFIKKKVIFVFETKTDLVSFKFKKMVGSLFLTMTFITLIKKNYIF